MSASQRTYSASRGYFTSQGWRYLGQVIYRPPCAPATRRTRVARTARSFAGVEPNLGTRWSSLLMKRRTRVNSPASSNSSWGGSHRHYLCAQSMDRKVAVATLHTLYVPTYAQKPAGHDVPSLLAVVCTDIRPPHVCRLVRSRRERRMGGEAAGTPW